MPFRALHLSPQVLQAVHDAGYTEPTPIQVAAIPHILGGHDVIGIAQTGTGKTAAFVLPILTKLAASIQNGHRRGPRALVVAPTRELVVQIEENVRAYAKHLPLRMATVFGGVSERPQIAALRSGVDLVVATPGRLIDLMEQRAANLSGVEFLVLDEADRMLDMGFLPPIRRIVKALPQKRQTLMFSASLSREIEELTHQFQHSPKIVEIGRRANPAETVTQFAYEVRSHLKPALLLHLLRDPQFDTVLVFARTKHGADRIARRLESSGIKTGTIHSNRSQNQRLRALKDFKSGRGAGARGNRHRGAWHRRGWDFARRELRLSDALGGLRSSHRAHGSRARHRRRNQLHHAGGPGAVTLAGTFHRSRSAAETGGRLRLRRGAFTARRAAEGRTPVFVTEDGIETPGKFRASRRRQRRGAEKRAAFPSVLLAPRRALTARRT